MANVETNEDDIVEKQDPTLPFSEHVERSESKEKTTIIVKRDFNDKKEEPTDNSNLEVTDDTLIAEGEKQTNSQTPVENERNNEENLSTNLSSNNDTYDEKVQENDENRDSNQDKSTTGTESKLMGNNIAADESKSEATPENVVEHEVQANETLYSITMKYYLSSHHQKTVAEYNGITNASSELKAGMTLQLPDPPIIDHHQVKAKDTLYSLSQQYYGSGNYVASLANYNKIINPATDFKVGMTLKIPNRSMFNGYMVQINKSTNRLSVYHNNQLVRSFPVATGKDQSRTPEGFFQIINKVVDPWYNPSQIPGGDPSNPLGSHWLGLNVPGTNGSIYGIHGTNDSSSIGKYISLGCIRMYNDDVNWLYDTLPLQTLVYIFTD
ncbi:L,D-transpeptidase family protein [Bacillus alkalicola]|uniref:L,D-transpeptidase family protein n=2 Tax=Bacillaceae TaxID=186817 RepID=A0ABS6JQE5_9BACI|nr:L,D-transpeptidase family protein [Bacillus alkalicola]MBU9720769.1 L,D-transpeptidase family protein [Bacillus alkalicola]